MLGEVKDPISFENIFDQLKYTLETSDHVFVVLSYCFCHLDRVPLSFLSMNLYSCICVAGPIMSLMQARRGCS